MKSQRILFRLAMVIAILFLTSLPPFPHQAFAEDDSDNASDMNDDHSSMDDGDKDDDRQADKDDDSSKDDAHKSDSDDDEAHHPKPARHFADKPAPPTAQRLRPSARPEAPASAPASNGSWWHPHPGVKWQIQYVGSIDPATKVDMFDLDVFDTSADTIKALHDHGVKVVCYFSAGSHEGWRSDAKRFPKSVLGRALEGWKYERWLDIRKLDILRPIMEDRIKMAQQKGCDAIDPDNVEGYDNKSGFALTPADQIAYNKMIAELGHSMGMAVGLKNDLDQVEDLLPYFDFQVNEQCFEYHGCDELIPFIKANKPVFNIEYNVGTDKFCHQANAMNFDSLKKDLDLGMKVKSCR